MTDAARFHPLADLSYVQVQAILAQDRPTVALIPVGATEAHGPHLPLATDSLISTAVAEAAGQRLAAQGLEAVAFPTLDYAVTDWAAGFAGTVSIPATVASELVLSVCKGARAMGFDCVALVNSHLEPDNIATLRTIAKRYADETGSPLAFADQTRRKWAQRLTEEFQSGSCHAGQYETSLVLAIAPQLVDQGAARALPRHHVPLHERIRDGARNFKECGLDQAYCGDPAAASPEEGRATLQALAALTVEAVQTALVD